MTDQDSAIQSTAVAPQPTTAPGAAGSAGVPGTALAPGASGTALAPGASGTALAALGVLSFSVSFPATAWALTGFGPWTATGLRGAVAGVIAAVCLAAARVPLPARRHWPGLLVVAAGCVLGFPLLTTLALRTSSTAHSAVVIGVLPLATAAFSALRTGRRPSRTFWGAALAGAVAVLAFTLLQSHGRPTVADLYLFAALLVCAAGYAEGGRISRELPGWQVIAWAVVAALPVTVFTVALALPAEPVHLGAKALAGLAYTAVVSQFGGFVLWYRGMAAIGVPRASQLQLAQPLLTLVWSVLLLGEDLPAAAPVTAVAVLVCIVVTQRARD
ncbi:DMT family transporter [Streptomyces sp. CB01881]|uniref:DMT family transporter n=1 Tax=Streptomyces sp. CB01881 TaxID=2078691 RepID=UPI000CDCB395|nr:DMT family transporter [Streptomyces sp. CB01881]AUY51245.1 EamA family transporter [Streptomyces sp. CB01881]TYC74632.1 DMT family transporter [Streptomyces sp. CB01881]